MAALRTRPGLTQLSTLWVAALPANRRLGRLAAGHVTITCALGRGGISHSKREGDGATPAGRLSIERILVRPDRVTFRTSRLGIGLIGPATGWCDDPLHGQYNRSVKLPFAAAHEELWRADRVYDVIGVLDWNRVPRVRHRGSAIFFHLARPDYEPTAGCIAISANDMRRLLPRLGRSCLIRVADRQALRRK